MMSPHIASTLRPRNVSRGSRFWRRDASQSQDRSRQVGEKEQPGHRQQCVQVLHQEQRQLGHGHRDPRPEKNKLTVARRYSRDPSTKPSVELDLVVTACSGIRLP